MSIPVVNINARIVEPAEVGTSRQGEYASLIIDVGTTTPDHWYAHIYPSGHDDYGDLTQVMDAQRGNIITFSGVVRRWTKSRGSKVGSGVTIDIKEAFVHPTREDETSDTPANYDLAQ